MSRLSEVTVWVGRTGKRVAVTVVGFGLIVVGLVLLVFPGPGLLLIVAGLAVLATQYTWATACARRDEEKGRIRDAPPAPRQRHLTPIRRRP